MQQFSYFDKREVLQQEYCQPLIFPSPHFLWVVDIHTSLPCKYQYHHVIIEWVECERHHISCENTQTVTSC